MDWLYAVLLSMTPVGELRAGLPFALASGVPVFWAWLICVVANFFVVPVLFLFLEFIHFRFLHQRHYRTLFDWVMERTRRRAHVKVERYGYLGLFVLTAVPLPFTGAYTATIAAWFFGMKKWKASFAILLGVMAAGVIVASVFQSGVGVVGFFVS